MILSWKSRARLLAKFSLVSMPDDGYASRAANWTSMVKRPVAKNPRGGDVVSAHEVGCSQGLRHGYIHKARRCMRHAPLW